MARSRLLPPGFRSQEAGGRTEDWITSEPARAHVQELRHQNDAILVGVGTVIADDPLLTDRSGRSRRRPLLRVILDSRLRLPLESRLVQTAKNDVLVLCSFAEEKQKEELLDMAFVSNRSEPSPPMAALEMKSVVELLGRDGNHQPDDRRRRA